MQTDAFAFSVWHILVKTHNWILLPMPKTNPNGPCGMTKTVLNLTNFSHNVTARRLKCEQLCESVKCLVNCFRSIVYDADCRVYHPSQTIRSDFASTRKKTVDLIKLNWNYTEKKKRKAINWLFHWICRVNVLPMDFHHIYRQSTIVDSVTCKCSLLFVSSSWLVLYIVAGNTKTISITILFFCAIYSVHTSRKWTNAIYYYLVFNRHFIHRNVQKCFYRFSIGWIMDNSTISKWKTHCNLYWK